MFGLLRITFCFAFPSKLFVASSVALAYACGSLHSQYEGVVTKNVDPALTPSLRSESANERALAKLGMFKFFAWLSPPSFRLSLSVWYVMVATDNENVCCGTGMAMIEVAIVSLACSRKCVSHDPQSTDLGCVRHHKPALLDGPKDR